MNGAADSQHHGSQTPGQTEKEPNKKSLGTHAYGTADAPREVRDNRREGGKARPRDESLRWLMGLEPTTLPLEVAPSAHDFVRLVQVQRHNPQPSERGRAKPDHAATV
jgi:hypothetical protein